MNKISCLVLDVDGVLTDSRIYFTDEGIQIKAFNSKDGHGLRMLLRAGIEVVIITGRTSKALEYRAQELGITNVFQGAIDKKPALLEAAQKLGIPTTNMAYMGDDVVDIPPMALCGMTFAPADAMDMVKERAEVVTTRPGGHGAVREAIEIILKREGLFDKIMERYVE
jgi:3-deoxy-D-manno-octulosonate 8-phosphate phosphatase (KDO 8-P phosphatase)